MTQLRISRAAELLGVSDDTVRRWISDGRLVAHDGAGPATVDSADLVAIAEELQAGRDGRSLDDGAGRRSARNRFTGLITRVVSDQVMSQVELRCGPYRVVALISTEAVAELGLAVGEVATAVVKATNVTVEK